MKDFYECYGIKHVLNAVASPRANGQCERYNRTIINSLAATSAGRDIDEWDKCIKQVQSANNTTHNKSINATPMEALIGCNTRHVSDSRIIKEIQEHLKRMDLQELRQEILEHITQDQKMQKERYDKSRCDAIKYCKGDLVMVRITSEPATGGSRKLLPKFKGPFRITCVLYNDRYEVEDLRGLKKSSRTVVAADNIKRWLIIQDDDKKNPQCSILAQVQSTLVHHPVAYESRKLIRCLHYRMDVSQNEIVKQMIFQDTPVKCNLTASYHKIENSKMRYLKKRDVSSIKINNKYGDLNNFFCNIFTTTVVCVGTETHVGSLDPASPKMIPSFTQCRPISSRSDIEECLSYPPEWVNRVIPLRKRSEYVIRNTLTDCHCKENSFLARTRIDSRTVPKTLVCHDYRGGYLSDSYVPFEGVEDKTLATEGYTFYNWSQIDYFVYFSHHFVTIPPLAWVNAGHKNGVKVLGTLITENADGLKICNEEIFKTSDQMREFVYQLTEIQKTFGFDGWLLNIENAVSNPEILKNFVRILTTKTHQQDSESVVLWYDSVTNEGQLKWQNELNDLNRCFFDACDGIFLNYTWNEKNLMSSATVAGARRFDVFVGLDIFGRNQYSGGKFNAYKAVEMITAHNLSLAIFAPGWTYETMDKVPYETSFARFLNRDDALWISLWPYLYTHPLNDFFETDFHMGLDSNYYNLYIQKQQTSRMLHPEYPKTIPNYSAISTLNTCDCLKRGFFEYRNVCLISNARLEASNTNYIHNLFVCDINLNGKMAVYFLTNKLDSSDVTRLEVTLLTCLRSGSIRKIKLLGKPNSLPLDNMSVLEVNEMKEYDVQYHASLNAVAKKHMRLLNKSNFPGTIALSMFEFSTTPCNLLEIGASVVNGSSIYLIEFGILQL